MGLRDHSPRGAREGFREVAGGMSGLTDTSGSRQRGQLSGGGKQRVEYSRNGRVDRVDSPGLTGRVRRIC